MISNGVGIDSIQTVAATTRIFDIRGTSRPLTVRLAIAAGETLTIATSTVAAALVDENHASWTVIRTRNGAYHTETFINTSTSLVGIRVRRTAGAVGTSTARVFSLLRPIEPRYDPFIDRLNAGTNDVRRLYDQCTFGATPGQITSFTGAIGAWLETQFALPVYTYPLPGFGFTGTLPFTASQETMRAWINATDQLRIRVANVLSQIIPAGYSQNTREGDFIYWQQGLVNAAFGNYRDVLLHTTVSYLMGQWLNNRDNTANGIAPNQNYARELCQLFATGLDFLNKDGTTNLDSRGRPVRAYLQDDIAAAARLLAGWTTTHLPPDSVMTTRTDIAYTGPAVTMFGQVFPQIVSPTGTDIINRRDAVLDLIMAQQSTAVYVSKSLIQKLVTDNPSRGYIRRVVAAFENNGSGVRGDMKAILRAIFFDAEARGNSPLASGGRVMDATFSVIKGFRYAQQPTIGSRVSGSANLGPWYVNNGGAANILPAMGQAPTVPGTVFNDYPFDFQIGQTFAPAAALWRTNALLANHASFSSGGNALGTSADPNYGAWLMTDIVALGLSNNALVDRLWADWNQGRTIPTDVQTELRGFAAECDAAGETARTKACWLVCAIRTLPESWRIT